MNFIRTAGAFLLANKRFSLKLAVNLSLAAFWLICGLVIAVYNNSSPEQAVASEISAVSQVLPPAAVAQLNFDQPANLSSKQWKQLSDLLRALPSAVTNLKSVRKEAGFRQTWMLSLGNAVFERFNELPQASRDDWNALQQIDLRPPNDNDFDAYPTASMMQAAFLSKTLSVAEVQKLIKVREAYGAWRKRILESSALIDRLRPVLMPLKISEGQPSWNDPLQQVGDSFEQFIKVSHVGPSEPSVTAYPPPQLPILDFTYDDVAKQLSQPPLSKGNTSNERAGNPVALPDSVQPKTLGPAIDN